MTAGQTTYRFLTPSPEQNSFETDNCRNECYRWFWLIWQAENCHVQPTLIGYKEVEFSNGSSRGFRNKKHRTWSISKKMVKYLEVVSSFFCNNGSRQHAYSLWPNSDVTQRVCKLFWSRLKRTNVISPKIDVIDFVGGGRKLTVRVPWVEFFVAYVRKSVN